MSLSDFLRRERATGETAPPRRAYNALESLSMAFNRANRLVMPFVGCLMITVGALGLIASFCLWSAPGAALSAAAIWVGRFIAEGYK